MLPSIEKRWGTNSRRKFASNQEKMGNKPRDLTGTSRCSGSSSPLLLSGRRAANSPPRASLPPPGGVKEQRWCHSSDRTITHRSAAQSQAKHGTGHEPGYGSGQHANPVKAGGFPILLRAKGSITCSAPLPASPPTQKSSPTLQGGEEVESLPSL